MQLHTSPLLIAWTSCLKVEVNLDCSPATVIFFAVFVIIAELEVLHAFLLLALLVDDVDLRDLVEVEVSLLVLAF